MARLHDHEAEKLLGDAFGGNWMTFGFADGGKGVARYTRNEAGRWVLSGLIVVNEPLTARLLHKISVDALENSINLSNEDSARKRERIRDLPPLRREDYDDPEEFSRLVAEHYRAWAELVPHPAGAMAADAGVKPPTVHTWIREARLRGLLPPGKRGKTK